MNRIFLCFFCVLFLSGVASSVAQTALPDTDIFLVTLISATNKLQCGPPVNLTKRAGYDNQPSFTPDGQFLLYTSIREDNQADIYRYSFREKLSARVTATPESEYSPTVEPDGKSFSVIRVERDSTQRLWEFDLRGANPSIVLPAVKPVGYHAWIDDHTLALFLLGKTANSLHIADIRTGKAEQVADSIGRSLHKVPKERAVSFVQQVATGDALIKQMDVGTKQMITLAETLTGSADYVWMPAKIGKILLMAQGSKLFMRDVNKRENKWQEIADFGASGIRTITRLAVNPDGSKLAFVAESPKELSK